MAAASSYDQLGGQRTRVLLAGRVQRHVRPRFRPDRRDGTGLVSKAEAQLWADEVWADRREEDEESDREVERPADRGSSRE